MKSTKMCRILLLVLAAITLGFPVRAATETLPEQYLAFYLKINQAQSAERKNDFKGALETFEDCYKQLVDIQKSDPDWEACLVIHRMDDVKAKIIELGPKVYPPAPANDAIKDVPAVATSTNLPPAVKAFQEALPRLEAEADPEQQPQVKAFFDSVPPALPPNHINYPWKANIPASVFWIGEDNSKASAWASDIVHENGGTDNPYDRSGYAAGNHASRLNTFYVALPFNDLAHPELAQMWLPKNWARAPRDGKPVSACKDRWVELKNGRGDFCYAQWKDAGPGVADKAEYVFGDQPPGKTGEPGISLSPAARDYFGVDGGDASMVSWRFVDDANVQPGPWLKLDEQAVIYTAMHRLSAK